MDPVAAAAAAAAAEIAGGVLVHTGPSSAATTGISVSSGTLMITASPFASHSPAIGGTTAPIVPNASIAQQQQQQQQIRASLLGELSAAMHFCSSCKKRMYSDAFRRRKNGGLYSTCIMCLDRTKIRKGAQRCRGGGGGAVAYTERHASPVMSQDAAAAAAAHSQEQPQETGATVSASDPATNSLCAEQQRTMSSESPSQEISIVFVLLAGADAWEEPLTPLSLGRTPTGHSDGPLRSRQLPHTIKITSNETGQTLSATGSLASDDLGIIPPSSAVLPWAIGLSQPAGRSTLQSLLPTSVPPVPELLTPTTSPLSPLPLAKRRRASTMATHCTHDLRLQQHHTGHVIPDAYVQLELQRLELERQRLALDQERWREERAERMRWEQMYREQWQEEREERKAFRERELHIWKILLALKAPNDSPSL
ncbi:hypothetical protein GGI22_001788 [Coemansia erecta]|nr:hypothetical protein GGI22_001788 [Coemansia erecta]